MESYNKTAVITGANRGIGRAIAVALAENGYNIVGISRSINSAKNFDSLNELMEIIESHGVVFHPLQMDIGDLSLHKKTVIEIIDRFGKIDILVNNAGIAPQERRDILKTTVDSYDEVLDVNLKGPFFFTQRVAEKMMNTLSDSSAYLPRIVFITSVSAEMPSTNRPEYCISKTGLSMVARLFAARFADSGIRVFEIRPGIINTDMTAPVKDKYDKAIAEGLIPQNRWGRPEDIAKVMASISRGDFDYSNGMIFEVSGGMNIRPL